MPLDEFRKDRCRPDGLGLYCKRCMKAYAKKYREEHPPLEYMREWRKNNREKYRKYGREWATRNRKPYGEYQKAWGKLNPQKITAYSSRNRARRLLREPAWADRTKIRRVYELCRVITEGTGVQHQVDHVIPLVGELISGLHVHQNLQILTAEENTAKGNSWSSH